MEKLISVIVPVYNVEKYLNRCVDSILKQTYKNLEILLVDDGSLDNSGNICDKYEKEDKRIKVIHKSNGGLSDARNVGFKNSSGDYIFFLDSDDWISENTISRLLEAINDNSADISVANYYYQYDDHNFSSVKAENDYIFDKEKAMEELLKNKIIKNFAWGKLYKREMINDLKFPVGKLFEDTYWTHLVFDRANKVVFVKDELVYYYQRSDSISYTFDSRRIHLIEGNIERRKFIQQKYPDLLYLCDECIISLITGIYIGSLKQRDYRMYSKIKKQLINNAKWLKREIKSNLKKIPKNFNQLNEFCVSPYYYLVKEIFRRLGGKNENFN